MAIKKVWIVECIEDGPLMDGNGNAIEFKSESAALKKAKLMVAGGQEQVLVYGLTHVVSRPEIPAEVEKVGSR